MNIGPIRWPSFGRADTTEGIVKPLQKIVKELEEHAAAQSLASDNKVELAAVLMSEAKDHDGEANRALTIRDKIAGLIG